MNILKIIFEAIAGPESDGNIAIDDVIMVPGACPPLGSCTFENGMCTWQNSEQSDDFDWLLSTGETMTAGTGPTQDHTLGTPYGKLKDFNLLQTLLQSTYCYISYYVF